MVLATSAPPSWSEATIQNPQGVEALRNQLVETAPQDFNAVIIQAQAGTGKLRMLRRKAEAPEVALPVPAEPTADITSTETPTTPIKAVESPIEDHPLGIPTSEMAPAEPITEPVELSEPEVLSVPIPGSEVLEETGEDKGLGVSTSTTPRMPEELSAISPAEDEIVPTALPPTPITEIPAPLGKESSYPGPSTEEPTSEAELETGLVSSVARPARKEHPAPKPAPWAKYLISIQATLAPVGTAILRALRSALGTIGAATLRLLKNLLPDADVLHVPPSLMVFVAIAIPLILAVVGGTVFLQRGRAQQYQVYYQQAVEQATKVANLTDPTEQRTALQTSIEDLDKAEYYTVTSQSQELRAQVVAQLDTLDAVKRLDYKQAIVGGLDSEISVTHMVATTTDLYLLNGKQGNVLHAIMTARGYELDPNFQCGPTYGPINVGPLVDIVELPPGSFENASLQNASLLGMDANGNLLYCVVGSQPYSAAMAPPNTGFGEPSALSLDRGDLYLLDPKVNAVWIYRNLEVSQQPRLFFGDTVPHMEDVIDLAEYNNDLFLLHADGKTTKCTYSALAESPTHCDDPYPYSDNRPGRSHGPVIADAVFNQIYFLNFPERSIFMLDPQNRSIYYFSVLLTLQWQYQPKGTLAAGNATAFALSPNRMAFLAVGNSVYYAAMP